MKPDETKREYRCARGCGCTLEPWWKFCPACGQSFGRTNIGTVLDSVEAGDGRVAISSQKESSDA